MVDIRHNTASSRTEKALGGAIASGTGGGIFGALTGMVAGAVYGAIAGLALIISPLGVVGAVGGAIAGPMIATAGLSLGSIFTGVLVGAVAAPVAVGALGGMAAGAGIGGGIGMGLFGAKGALGGIRDANDEDQRYALRKQNSQLTLDTAKSKARGEAAEYYTAAGYQTGFEEGKNFVVNKIIEAKQQQMMMAAQQGDDHGFVERHAKGKKSENHVQASEQVATAIPGQPTV